MLIIRILVIWMLNRFYRYSSSAWYEQTWADPARSDSSVLLSSRQL